MGCSWPSLGCVVNYSERKRQLCLAKRRLREANRANHEAEETIKRAQARMARIGRKRNQLIFQIATLTNQSEST